MGRHDLQTTPNRTKETRHRTNKTNPLTNVGQLMKNLIIIPAGIIFYFIIKNWLLWHDTKTPPIKYPDKNTD
jgi:hypothetical protein